MLQYIRWLVPAGAVVVALPLGASARQTNEVKTLTGHVTITTSAEGRATAVLGKKDAQSKAGEFLFCIDNGQPPVTKTAFAGPARVIYRALPPPAGIPPGIKVTGPENVASVLAVVPNEGKATVFLGKGQKPPFPAGAPAMAGATIVNVVLVRRVDWIADNGGRRGTDLAGCLAPGG